MRLSVLLPTLTAALAVAGCSVMQPVDRAQIVIADPSPTPEAMAPRSIPMDELTYAALEGSDAPLILASLDDGQRTMTLTPAETDGETMRWVATDGTGFHFQGVQLVATEKLGDDLMAVEQTEVASVVPAMPFSRAYHHGTAGGMRVTSLSCEMAEPVEERIEILDMPYETLRLDETCTGADGVPITNAYWVGIDDGTLWQSRQWVSAEAGFLDLKRLVR